MNELEREWGPTLTKQASKFPPKAVDFNRLPDSDGFWGLRVGEANRMNAIRLAVKEDTEMGDLIFYLNMAAGGWASGRRPAGKTAGGETAIAQAGANYTKSLEFLYASASTLRKLFKQHPVDPALDDRGRGKAAEAQVTKVLRFLQDLERKDPILMGIYTDSPQNRLAAAWGDAVPGTGQGKRLIAQEGHHLKRIGELLGDAADRNPERVAEVVYLCAGSLKYALTAAAREWPEKAAELHRLRAVVSKLEQEASKTMETTKIPVG